MKIICLFLLLVNIAANSQEYFEDDLSVKIDSLQKLIDQNNLMIEELEMKNKNIGDNLKNYKKQLNDILIENKKGEIFVCEHGTFLYSRPSRIEVEELCKISRGDRVNVVGVEGRYYNAYFNDMYGFVFKTGFKNELELIEENNQRAEIEELKRIKEEEREKLFEQQKQERKKLEDQQRQQQKRLIAQRKQSLILKYGNENGIKIFEGKIWLGMNKEMVIESLGNPSNVNRTVGNWGVREQWVYYKKYLYFENGILTSFQD